MNLAEIEIRNKSAEHARALLERARAFEPEITADLQRIAAEFGAEMVGLNHKFKTEESLTRKLIKESIASFKSLADLGYLYDEAVGKATKRQAERNNDALRYMFLFPFEKYVFGFKQTLEKLKQSGYKIPENKIWNAWKNIGTNFDKGYRGINVTVFSSRNQIFELQFHTRESHKLKTETHFLYDESRQSGTLLERKIEISEIVIELAQKVKVPKGVKKL
ncbi:MAG TPA: hypothetical protein PKE69_00305 [Pyrinomonadaceae bacterium]|nr:hypothetical protein [Pyrinomonadaceae bacterium]